MLHIVCVTMYIPANCQVCVCITELRTSPTLVFLITLVHAPLVSELMRFHCLYTQYVPLCS